ncbi:MAG: rhomboid family intramembrane serine protease [Planctomycetes bacterium]|nr:rhomboid family intramembrane serine protease [Planctomycetota bacterium]
MKTARDYDEPFEPESDSGGGPSFRLPRVESATRAMLTILIVFGVLGFVFGDVGWGATVYNALALNPEQWRAWAPWLPVWQLVTHGLLHSWSDPMHLLSNCLTIYVFGSLFESSFGARRTLAWVVAAVFAGGCAELLQALVFGHSKLGVGASGGALFLLVAMATLKPNLQIFTIFVVLRLRTLALILIGFDLLRLLFALKGRDGDVAFLAHLSGAALGFLAVRQRWVWIDPLAELESRREARAVASREDDERRLDALLERIHREGIGSLSAREREFLKRMSARRGGG